MSDVLEHRMNERIDRIDGRTQRIEQKIYNGMSHTLEHLEAKLPHLLTKEEHEIQEKIRRENMEEIGRRKDRYNRIFIACIPAVTALLLWLLNQT